MSNPFATQSAPAAAAPAQGGNPFGGQTAAQAPAANPFGGQPAAQGGGSPFGAAPAGDPFASAPEVPTFVGLSQNDAILQTVVAWRIVKLDEGIVSSFKDEKTGQPVVQDRLTVEGFIVTGPRAGEVLSDAYIYWGGVVRQFKGSAGNGQWYLVQLSKPGKFVKADEVTDPAIRAKAAALIQGGGQ